MSLSTYLLEYGRHVARLRRRRRRRAYAPTSNTASHDNHKKILHGFPFLSRDDYGAPLGGPSGRRSSAIIYVSFFTFVNCIFYLGGTSHGSLGLVRARPFGCYIFSFVCYSLIVYSCTIIETQ